LSLLEDHFQKLREEDDVEMNDEDEAAAWEGWDVETDSSGDESESEDWIEVSDDENDLVVSDSDDDEPKPAKAESAEPDAPKRISTLATTKILTPADFALLNELRIKQAEKAVDGGGGSHAKRKLAELEANKKSLGDDNTFISENDILGPRKKAKADYEERMASIQKGREGREKFKSNKGKVNKETPSSSTNKEKARNKPIMMILSSGAVRGKKKASLRDKQRKLRKHIDNAKKSRR